MLSSNRKNHEVKLQKPRAMLQNTIISVIRDVKSASRKMFLEKTFSGFRHGTGTWWSLSFCFKNHGCRIFLGRQEPTYLRRRQNDQNTLKIYQTHHFYATILARRRQTLKSWEPRSPDPGVCTGTYVKNYPLIVLSPDFFRIFQNFHIFYRIFPRL